MRAPLLLASAYLLFKFDQSLIEVGRSRLLRVKWEIDRVLIFVAIKFGCSLLVFEGVLKVIVVANGYCFEPLLKLLIWY